MNIKHNLKIPLRQHARAGIAERLRKMELYAHTEPMSRYEAKKWRIAAHRLDMQVVQRKLKTGNKVRIYRVK